MQDKILDMQSNVYNVNTRKIWQELFNYYKEYGDLSNLDNMLIDYDTIEFLRKGESNNCIFLWGYHAECYSTILLQKQDWWYKDDINHTIKTQLSEWDIVILVNIDEKNYKSTFSVAKKIV